MDLLSGRGDQTGNRESGLGMDDASGFGSDAETAAKPITAKPRQVQNPYRIQSDARAINSLPSSLLDVPAHGRDHSGVTSTST